jgi:hypothetical protein
MTYDDARWHLTDEFPANLPHAAAATHTGMFVAWALLSGLGGGAHATPEHVFQLAGRTITPGAFLLAECGGRFTDDDLDAEGNAFAQDYFDFDEGEYLDDYEAAVGQGTPSGPQGLYYVDDTWDNFDRLAPVLDRRFAEWRARR